jgi:hypothetical protein
MRGTSRVAKIALQALGWSMMLSACVAPAAGLNGATEDRSYDQIERARSLVGLSVAEDRSYDQIERARSLVGLSVAEDRSYDQIERTRSAGR